MKCLHLLGETSLHVHKVYFVSVKSYASLKWVKIHFNNETHPTKVYFDICSVFLSLIPKPKDEICIIYPLQSYTHPVSSAIQTHVSLIHSLLYFRRSGSHGLKIQTGEWMQTPCLSPAEGNAARHGCYIQNLGLFPHTWETALKASRSLSGGSRGCSHAVTSALFLWARLVRHLWSINH